MNSNNTSIFYKNILFISAIIYIFFYLSSNMLPGNDLQNPVGWWGWFDQGQYRLEAKNLSNLNFSGFYFYPPLYAMVGSLFYKFMPNHLFFFVNLFSFLVYVYFFIKLAEKFIGRTFAVASLCFGLFYDNRIFEQFVIPWTTTPTAAIIAMSLYILYSLQELEYNKKQFIRLQIAFVFFTGLLVALRPIDAFILCITIYPFYIYTVIKTWKECFKNQISFIRMLLLNTVFGLFGIVVFLLFNYITTGSIFGNYFTIANSNGFSFFRIFEKFTDIFVDSYSMYYIKNATLFNIFPWLYAAFASILFLFFIPKFQLRFLLVLIVVYISMYICYNDFVINGLWQYCNIHYFKWFFPYLAFIIVLSGKYLICSEKRYIPFVFSCILIFLIFILNYHYKIEYVKKSEIASYNLEEKSIIFTSLQKIDGIDIYTDTNQSFVDMYFGKHKIFFNNNEIDSIKDFRIIPTDFGMRVILYKPIYTNKVVMNLIEQVIIDNNTKFKPFKYSYALNFPNDKKEIIYNDYEFDSNVSLSSKESQKYIIDGFSGAESFGRWSDKKNIEMAFELDKLSNNMCLNITIGAFLNANGTQKIKLNINDNFLKEIDFNQESASMRLYSFKVQSDFIKDNKADLKIEVKYPTSPADLKLNSDSRKLGISVGDIAFVECK